MKRVHLVALALAFALGGASPALAAPPPADETSAERAFLAANAKSPGVVSLPGLQYKVLRSGPVDGPHPLRSDDVTVRYVGQFPDGQTFGSSGDNGAGPEIFPLQKLIPGWIAALQLMRPGDVWMLYVPAYLAYGVAGKSTIPPNSTLVFRVELLATAPHRDAPPAMH